MTMAGLPATGRPIEWSINDDSTIPVQHMEPRIRRTGQRLVQYNADWDEGYNKSERDEKEQSLRTKFKR